MGSAVADYAHNIQLSADLLDLIGVQIYDGYVVSVSVQLLSKRTADSVTTNYNYIHNITPCGCFSFHSLYIITSRRGLSSGGFLSKRGRKGNFECRGVMWFRFLLLLHKIILNICFKTPKNIFSKLRQRSFLHYYYIGTLQVLGRQDFFGIPQKVRIQL
jgi:hypothetical protein